MARKVGEAVPGRSPWARGSHQRHRTRGAGCGSIPVGTGEPWRAGASLGHAGVDPRGHGGADAPDCVGVPSAGRSPWARGSPRCSPSFLAWIGSIPVGTGEPRCGRSSSSATGVDPRGHGGASHGACTKSRTMGRSPWARGSPFHRVDLDRLHGSIPVGTGEPAPRRTAGQPTWVDPRGHGGAGVAEQLIDAVRGRSPWARGSLRRHGEAHPQAGSIPVGTGEPPSRSPGRCGAGVDPRGHGGAPGCPCRARCPQGRSPWARGSLLCQVCIRVRRGSIPVGTGEPGQNPQASRGHRSIPVGTGEPALPFMRS